MSHLERRRNLWYAVLTVPVDAREKLDKMRFVKSLGTADKRQAQIEAAPLVAKWKAEIRQARGKRDALTEEAMRWKRHLREQQDSPYDPHGAGMGELEEQLIDRARELEQYKGQQAADRLWAIATGAGTLTDAHYDEWKAQLSLQPKTVDQMTKDVRAMCDRFPLIGEISRKEVRRWLADCKASQSTTSRTLSNCRNYWGYLTHHEVVEDGNNPFSGIIQATKQVKLAKGHWSPFQTVELVKLWEAARSEGDEQLANLIKIAAYSGMRIEEVCSMKLTDMDDKVMNVTGAKTTASHRAIPIHSKLVPLVESLKKQSKDGYLLTGLTFNKYGDRSNAIGKRFGRLKKGLGYPVDRVFHSIRKTFTTELENAGVPENVTADLVGHEKPTMTYGLYSGGNRYAAMKEAIEKVRYEGL